MRTRLNTAATAVIPVQVAKKRPRSLGARAGGTLPDSQFFPRHTTRLSLARFIDRLAILIQTHFEKASYVPVSTLSVFATVQPWEETVLGLLLVSGLATRFSLIAGGLLFML
jgi:hypothetical protein